MALLMVTGAACTLLDNMPQALPTFWTLAGKMPAPQSDAAISTAWLCATSHRNLAGVNGLLHPSGCTVVDF